MACESLNHAGSHMNKFREAPPDQILGWLSADTVIDYGLVGDSEPEDPARTYPPTFLTPQ